MRTLGRKGWGLETRPMYSYPIAQQRSAASCAPYLSFRCAEKKDSPRPGKKEKSARAGDVVIVYTFYARISNIVLFWLKDDTFLRHPSAEGFASLAPLSGLTS